jgi:putative DNA primase/helicase
MSALADRCKGRWREILGRLGVLDQKQLKGRDSPCPICRGRDRFRFADKGYGAWFCHGEKEGGGGVKLVMQVTGTDFKGAAKLIEGVLNGSGHYAGRPWSSGVGADISSGGAEPPRDPFRSWSDAWPDVLGTTVDTYLRARCIELTAAEAGSLRSHPALWHWIAKAKWPAMIALVGPYGGPAVTCHQTFLEVDGSGKAPVEKPRLFPAGVAPTGGVWFGEPDIEVADIEHEFAVAEGIESALSAMRIFGATCGCAALSDNGIRSLVLPPLPLARRVHIFADNDELGQSLSASKDAARRWTAEGRAVAISMSPEVGLDANDVWMRRVKAARTA